MIDDYLDTLAGALSFDRSLSRCVRQEVEDHLSEALAADPASDRLDAERRAIAKFGDPHVIAAQFAFVALAQQARKVGFAVLLVVASVFITMKARVAWYAFTQWSIRGDLKIVGGVVGSIDRYAFWLSVILCVASFAYISNHHLRQAFFAPNCRKPITHFFALCMAATGALIISITGDGVLTALQLLGTEPRIGALVPLVSMAVEIAGAGILVLLIRDIALRMASAATLLKA